MADKVILHISTKRSAAAAYFPKEREHGKTEEAQEVGSEKQGFEGQV